jgi:hypothetical protein
MSGRKELCLAYLLEPAGLSVLEDDGFAFAAGFWTRSPN